MRVVMVEFGRKACEMELEDSLASMQRAVGGLIQAVYEPGGRDAALICNEEGKLLGLPLNRALRDENGEIYDAVAGTFVICGAPPDSENFTSLKYVVVCYWLRLFAKPEFFVSFNGQIICVPVEEPCQ